MTLTSKCKYESEEKEECLLFDELWCPCSAYEEQKEEEEGKNMTVKEMVKEYLEKNGYDGLCREDCGCGLDDFMPCSQFALEGVPTCCTPAYKHIVKNGEFNEIQYSTEKGK